jgi:predicted nucleic acid-binding protein
MIVVVDTNIIFSALLNTKSNIGDLLLNSDDNFVFYSCAYMRVEIEKHWEKLLKLSRLSNLELREAQYRLFKKIVFLNEEIIPADIWLWAEKLVMDIDINDVDFLAITKFLDGQLWTGDKELYEGLKSIDYDKVLNTAEMLLMRKKLFNKRF